MNKKVLIPILIVIGIIILGFVIGAFSHYSFCTTMACPCENVVGERPCNSCTDDNAIFVIGIVNVFKTCSSEEIIICENNTEVDSRIDWDEDSCKFEWNFFVYK